MKPATKYRVKVRPGIKDETGATLAKKQTHTFITERPKDHGYPFRELADARYALDSSDL